MQCLMYYFFFLFVIVDAVDVFYAQFLSHSCCIAISICTLFLFKFKCRQAIALSVFAKEFLFVFNSQISLSLLHRIHVHIGECCASHIQLQIPNRQTKSVYKRCNQKPIDIGVYSIKQTKNTNKSLNKYRFNARAFTFRNN